MNSPRFLSKIPFGSFLIYPSPAKTDIERRARGLVLDIKRALQRSPIPSQTLIEYIIRRLRRTVDDHPDLRVLLGPNSVLVPMPRAGLPMKDAVWPADLIATAMAQQTLGGAVAHVIQRQKAVPKSAFAKPGERPTPRQHYESMTVLASKMPIDARVVLIDDVITKGATFSGAAARLAEAFPEIEISAFAISHSVDVSGAGLDLSQLRHVS